MARAEASSSHAKEQAAQTRAERPDFARWAEGYGVIRHTDATQLRIREMETRLAQQSRGDGVAFYELLHALDASPAPPCGWWFMKPTCAAFISTGDRFRRKISSRDRRDTPAARSTWCRPMPDTWESTHRPA